MSKRCAIQKEKPGICGSCGAEIGKEHEYCSEECWRADRANRDAKANAKAEADHG